MKKINTHSNLNFGLRLSNNKVNLGWNFSSEEFLNNNFNVIFLNQFERLNLNYGIIGIFGLFLLSIVSIYTHLFFPHNKIHNLIVIFFGILSLLLLEKKKFFEIKEPDLVIGYDLFILGVSKSEKLGKYFVLPLPLFGKEWIHKLNDENTFWGSRHLYLFIRKDFKKVSSLINDLENF